ncbi:MAG: hypothetical protein Q8867_02140 [Bacteroidota bacterium]|nr:hypothetical protein [Bacteroidota bacterium]
MLIYRFRVTTDEQEDFLREIEIQPGQTFLDFHEIIQSSADLEICERASFFTTDKKYKKHHEISLKPSKKEVKRYDAELDEIITDTQVSFLMKNSQLKNFIEDPHQRMIYEFHGKDPHVFNIELFKIIKTDEYVNLPRCVKSIGEISKKVDIPLSPTVAPPEEEGIIHPPLFPSDADKLFIGIQEDDSELAEIESNLNEIIGKEVPEVPEQNMEEKKISTDEEEEETTDESESMESIDDYDDIESLEIKRRDFDTEPDEY